MCSLCITCLACTLPSLHLVSVVFGMAIPTSLYIFGKCFIYFCIIRSFYSIPLLFFLLIITVRTVIIRRRKKGGGGGGGGVGEGGGGGRVGVEKTQDHDIVLVVEHTCTVA